VAAVLHHWRWIKSSAVDEAAMRAPNSGQTAAENRMDAPPGI